MFKLKFWNCKSKTIHNSDLVEIHYNELMKRYYLMFNYKLFKEIGHKNAQLTGSNIDTSYLYGDDYYYIQHCTIFSNNNFEFRKNRPDIEGGKFRTLMGARKTKNKFLENLNKCLLSDTVQKRIE